MRVGTPEASFRGIIDANRSAARPLARALLTAQQVTRRPGDLGRDDEHGGIEDLGTEWGRPGLREAGAPLVALLVFRIVVSSEKAAIDLAQRIHDWIGQGGLSAALAAEGWGVQVFVCGCASEKKRACHFAPGCVCHGLEGPVGVRLHARVHSSWT